MDTGMQSQAAPSLFVGRALELARLQGAFETAAGGQGGVAFVAGEPGIGKSSLCRQLASWVTERGGISLLGQCDDAGELSVPYLPFAEALRTAVLARDPADLTLHVAVVGGDLARIVPEIRRRLPDLAAFPAPVDPVEARYRLLQAATDFTRRISERVPILLILEDLQDADYGPLDLLTHLSRHVSDARMFI